jgi:hypothetical protein
VSTVCQVYHEPTSTIQFDFNDPTAANVGSNRYLKTTLFQKVDLGIPAVEFDRFAPKSAPGGYTTFHREGFRTVSIPFSMRREGEGGLSWAMRQLNTHIIGGCVIRFRMHGATDYLFIDVEPSQPSYYIDGRELALHDAATMMATVEGVTVQLTAQANLRGAAQPSSANLFTNSTLTRDSDDDGDPDVWAWVSASNITNQTISASGEAHQFDIATGAVRTMTQASAAASASVGQVWSCSFYARVTSSTMTNVQAQAVITWRTSAPADISTSSGTLVTLTPGFQRITLTATAPATTDRMVAGLQLDNTSATSATVQWKNASLELAAAPTPFTVATETVSMDPAATGMAEYLPVYNPGDAWSPCEFIISAPDASTALTDIYMSRKSSMGQPGRALTDFLNGPFEEGHMDPHHRLRFAARGARRMGAGQSGCSRSVHDAAAVGTGRLDARCVHAAGSHPRRKRGEFLRLRDGQARPHPVAARGRGDVRHAEAGTVDPHRDGRPGSRHRLPGLHAV